MRRNFEIRSFNFITWNWSKDVIIEDAKREEEKVIRDYSVKFKLAESIIARYFKG